MCVASWRVNSCLLCCCWTGKEKGSHTCVGGQSVGSSGFGCFALLLKAVLGKGGIRQRTKQFWATNVSQQTWASNPNQSDPLFGTEIWIVVRGFTPLGWILSTGTKVSLQKLKRAPVVSKELGQLMSASKSGNVCLDSFWNRKSQGRPPLEMEEP